MVTLQGTAVKFNNNLHTSHTGGRLSSDSGLLLVDELMDAFHFEDLIKQLITFKENRRYWTHTNQKILKKMVLQLIAGYKADSSADVLRHDPMLKTLSLEDALASQPSISHFFDRVTEQTIDDFQVFNQALIDQARLVRNDTGMIIDLDSTHSDTFGRQEQTDYNAHSGTHGYHPIVAFDGLTGENKSYFSPGRVNLIGEHIDYNGGNVLPCSITQGTYGVARKRADKTIRCYSLNFPDFGPVEFNLDDIVYDKADGWVEYVKGII